MVATNHVESLGARVLVGAQIIARVEVEAIAARLGIVACSKRTRTLS